MDHYILIDLERSLKTGVLFFWGPNQRGYTNNLSEAGSYSYKNAHEIVRQDLDRRTVAFSQEDARKLQSGRL